MRNDGRASEGGRELLDLLWRDRTARVLRNTIMLTLCVTLGTVAISLPLAWLTTQTNLPGRRVWTALLSFGVLLTVTVHDHRRHPGARDSVGNDACEFLVRRGAAELLTAQVDAGDLIAVRSVTGGALAVVHTRAGVDFRLLAPKPQRVGRDAELGAALRAQHDGRVRDRAHAAAGREPEGEQRDGETYYDDTEREIVRECYARLLAGEPLSGLVWDLNARGVRGLTGGRWTRASLTGMLRRPAMAGLLAYFATPPATPAPFPARTLVILRSTCA